MQRENERQDVAANVNCVEIFQSISSTSNFLILLIVLPLSFSLLASFSSATATKRFSKLVGATSFTCPHFQLAPLSCYWWISSSELFSLSIPIYFARRYSRLVKVEFIIVAVCYHEMHVCDWVPYKKNIHVHVILCVGGWNLGYCFTTTLLD